MNGSFRAENLPPWRSVLVVVAHPDDESFGLGAVIDGFVRSGASVSLLCFTRGEASTLHGVDGELSEVRAAELADAAAVLGIASVRLLSYPDGALAQVPIDELVGQVLDVVDLTGAEGLLAFDPSGVTGHPDHVRATAVADRAGERRGLGVLAWTLPNPVPAQLESEFGACFTGHDPEQVDVVLPVSRERQLEAVTRHPSQAVPGSVLWRRLELLGDLEHLRWVRSPATAPDAARA
ncbi:MAG: PIG-L family deacetylase [Actinomycetales bacterium]|nr:PIG-L family deacetylase [Actinomycetales bacterium]